MTNVFRTALGMMFLACFTALGCTNRSAPTEQLAFASHSASSDSAKPAATATAVYYTTLSPSDASTVASKLFDRVFEFRHLRGSGDFFFAEQHFTSAAGHGVSLVCTWQKADETKVELSTDLPKHQHDEVVEWLQNRYSESATKPSIR